MTLELLIYFWVGIVYKFFQILAFDHIKFLDDRWRDWQIRHGQDPDEEYENFFDCFWRITLDVLLFPLSLLSSVIIFFT